jgi:hypothetical protein
MDITTFVTGTPPDEQQHIAVTDDSGQVTHYWYDPLQLHPLPNGTDWNVQPLPKP